MGRYHLELGENERAFLMYALGMAYGVPAVKFAAGEPPADSLTLANRLFALVPAIVPRAPEVRGSAAASEVRPGVGEPLKLQNPRPDPPPRKAGS
jgi:hypothetical protein